MDVTHRQATLFLEDKTRAWRLHPNTRNQAMGMLEVTCVPAIMEETLIREYTVNLPTSQRLCGRLLGFHGLTVHVVWDHRLVHKEIEKKI